MKCLPIARRLYINIHYFLKGKGFEFYNSQLPTGKKENLNKS
jgi:hypothetical protein